MSKPCIVPPAPSSATSHTAEKRAWVRLQSNAKGSCRSLSAQRNLSWEARVCDISCGGIGLLLPRRYERGVLLTIELAEAEEGRKRFLLARVARTVQQSDGSWLVGCTLMNRLAEDELPLLLGSDLNPVP